MTRAGLLHFSVSCVLAIVSVAISPRPGFASGCHVPDRPALGGFRALDPFLQTDGPKGLSLLQRPVLVPKPCSGETPANNLPTSPLTATALFFVEATCDQRVSGWQAAKNPSPRP